MNSKTNTIRPTPLRSARTLGVHLPGFTLALLASGCGERFQLGEVNQGIDTPETAAAVFNAHVVVDGREDADATLIGNTRFAGPGVGDIDGDGYNDWMNVSRLWYGGPRPAGGVVRVEESEGPTFVLGDTRAAIEEYRIGDIDGDGRDDLAFGTSVGMVHPYELGPDESAEQYAALEASARLRWPQQRAFLSYGSAHRPAGEQDLEQTAAGFQLGEDLLQGFERELSERLSPEHTSYTAGQTLRLNALGDIDGDGFDDLQLTARFSWSPNVAGNELLDEARSKFVSHIIYGRAERFGARTVPDAEARWEGTLSLRGIGDVNGDGLDDVQAQTADALYLIAGSSDRFTSDTPLEVIGKPLPGPSEELLPRVTPLGDMDQDGFDELLVFWPDEGWHARNYLFYGSPSLLSRPLERSAADAVISVTSPVANVWQVGDWNGDGAADLVVLQLRVVTDEYSPFAGQEILIIPGTRRRYAGYHELSAHRPNAIIGDDNIWHAGVAGDLDGDGFADLFFTTAGYGVYGPAQREVFVKYGSAHFDSAPIR